MKFLRVHTISQLMEISSDLREILLLLINLRMVLHFKPCFPVFLLIIYIRSCHASVKQAFSNIFTDLIMVELIFLIVFHS